ncbi:DUF4145 domain-containing protein [Dactylosporangium cerinum]|uniref:DUF4145 domain-containing protein n=1 Tax=Dactylosporangium cerinum TaxID=1434730 RepID=A0ABV9WBI5_9ACTN
MDHPLLPLTDWFFDLPYIVCPSCSRGHLEKTGEFVTQRSAVSRQSEAECPEGFEPEWITGVFTGVLTCSLSGCLEGVAVAGGFEVVDKPTPLNEWNYQERYAERYRLRFAYPAPSIVACPPLTPKTVQDAACAAAVVMWTDSAGAAGRLRVAVEELMTVQAIDKYRPVNTQGGGQPPKPRTAHERITEFAQTKPDAAEMLLAVKWIGNSGSHESGLSPQDVLEGAQMLSHALRLLYDPSEADLKRRAALVNEHRGPAPRDIATSAKE